MLENGQGNSWSVRQREQSCANFIFLGNPLGEKAKDCLSQQTNSSSRKFCRCLLLPSSMSCPAELCVEGQSHNLTLSFQVLLFSFSGLEQHNNILQGTHIIPLQAAFWIWCPLQLWSFFFTLICHSLINLILLSLTFSFCLSSYSLNIPLKEWRWCSSASVSGQKNMGNNHYRSNRIWNMWFLCLLLDLSIFWWAEINWGALISLGILGILK